MISGIILLLTVCSAVLSDKCDNVLCPKIPKHYEELGCKPLTQPGKCCPISFDCTEFHSRDTGKCHHKGKVYEENQEIDDPELAVSCTVGCRCRRDYPDEPANIVCAHIDCPEFFGREENPGRNCISQYKPDQCCKVGEVCDDDLKKLATCTFRGQKYYEGQQIESDEGCYSCYCDKGFEDKPPHQNKHCRRINCNIDLHYSEKIHDGCVPLYYKTEDCCPIGTKCPRDTESVVKTKNSVQTPESLQCKFGNLKLSIGDNLSSEYPGDCKVCTCKTPPFVTCVQTC